KVSLHSESNFLCYHGPCPHILQTELLAVLIIGEGNRYPVFADLSRVAKTWYGLFGGRVEQDFWSDEPHTTRRNGHKAVVFAQARKVNKSQPIVVFAFAHFSIRSKPPNLERLIAHPSTNGNGLCGHVFQTEPNFKRG